MLRLIVLEIKDDNYLLEDIKTKERHNLNITFYGLKKMPRIGDMFALHEELLNPEYKEYSATYQFGPIDEIYGRKVTNSRHLDFMGVIIDNKKIYLKRFFG